METKPAELIGTGEAARILDVHFSTVLRWAADGRLKLVGKLPAKNGAMLFDRAAVEALAEVRRSPADVSR